MKYVSKINVFSLKERLNIFLIVLLFSLYYLSSNVPLRGPPSYLTPSILALLLFLLLKDYVLDYRGYFIGVIKLVPFIFGIKLTADVVSGAAFGFGLNVNSLDIISALIAVLKNVPIVLAVESLRVYALRKLSSKITSELARVLITATLFTLISVSAIKILNSFSEPQLLTSYLIKLIPPELAKNILLSELALAGGLRASSLYSILLTSYRWLSPYLPVPPWYVEVVIDIAILSTQVLALFTLLHGLPSRRSYSRKPGTEVLWVVGLFAVIVLAVAASHSNYRVMVVMSGSMEPYIRAGDVVIVGPAGPEDIDVGDVIAYASPSGVILHRLVNVIEGDDGGVLYVFKGDANPVEDPEPLPPEAIVGEMRVLIPYVGIPIYLAAIALGGFANTTALMISLSFIFLYIQVRSFIRRGM